MLIRVNVAEECDARDDDSSNAAGQIFSFRISKNAPQGELDTKRKSPSLLKDSFFINAQRVITLQNQPSF